MDRKQVARIGAWLVALSLLVPTPARTGGLSFVEFEQGTNPNTMGLRGARDVIVVDDNVYVVGNADDAISSWDRDTVTNALTFLEVDEDGVGGVDGMSNPNALVASIDNNCVYVATEDNPPGPGSAGAVVVFNRSGGGGLAFLEVHRDDTAGVDGLRNASAIAISLDDKHIYVAGENDNAIAIFSRTAPACALTFVGLVQNGLGGVQGLERPVGVAVSPDGGSVYAAARKVVGNNSIGTVVAFSRNSGTGALTYLETQEDGVNGVDRLSSIVSAVTVGGGFGTNVYAASQGGDSVVVFTRDLGTGALTYLETERRAGLAKGFKGASGISMSPTDAYVYVTGRGEDALAVFKRDFTTGKLEFLEYHVDLDPDVNVLGSAEAVAVVSDFSGGVYAVGFGPDTLVAFTEDRCGDGNRGVDEQCDDNNILDGDGCSSTCRLELCGPLVTGTCHAATLGGGAKLQIKDQPDDRKDQIKWNWKGEATMLSEYGDPVSTADYVICVYDGSGNPQPLVSRAAPSGGTCAGKPCWAAKPTQFQYSDKLFTPDGLKKTQLKEGLVDGKPKVQVQGVGVFIDPPALPLTLPVTVQVKNTQNLECWEATFSVADKNDAAQFKAKSD